MRRGPQGPSLIRDEAVIREINELWAPVYPWLAEHLAVISGGTGVVLDLGPFAGGIATALLERGGASRVVVLDETMATPGWAREQAARGGFGKRLQGATGLLDALPSREASFDLVIVRGAFFFLTPSHLREVARVVRPGGIGWVGGGYGPRTPRGVIGPIADRSRRLNAAVGKRWVSPQEAEELIARAGVAAEVSTEGGLWLEMRR